MDIWHGLNEVPENFDRSIATVGFFDGVHRGHQELIRTAVAAAKSKGLPCVLVTFDPHPRAVFAPGTEPAALLSVERKAELAGALGVDHMLVVPFTKEFAALSPEQFVGDILHDALGAQGVFVGDNFTYGSKAAGTAETLPGHASAHGMSATIVDLLEQTDETVSSTRIRRELTEGRVDTAAELLGRPHRLTGEVINGQGRGGAQLGFPTANLDLSEGTAVPVDGVYAAWFAVTDGPVRTGSDPDGDMLLGVKYPAAVSVGTNSTFDATERTVEAHVIGRSADLYGLTGHLDFVGFIRGMVKFDNVDDLIDQMNADVRTAMELLGEN